MRKVLLGCLVLFVVGSLVAGAACWYVLRKRPQLGATLELPPTARAGQTISLVARLDNPHDRPVTLDSIDIAESFLEGFQVLRVEPKPTDTTRVPIVNQRSWSFGQAVPAGGTMAVTFTLRCLRAGHFTGTVDACNPSQDCTSLYGDVDVQAGAPTETTAEPLPPVTN